MPGPIRNRIVAHRRLRAGDLVPHELNFRLHPEAQKAALQALYAEAHAALVARTKTQAQALKDLWQASARAADQAKKLLGKPAVQPGEPQFLILIECADEEQQLNLLEWLQAEGVRCRALLS